MWSWILLATLVADYPCVRVPEGDYWVGERGHPRNPLRKVHLRPFRIGVTEVTNAHFARFVEATGYRTWAERKGYGMTFHEGLDDWVWESTPGADWRHPFGPDDTLEGRENHPVTQISAEDAQAFCRWAGGRLPTTEEWEVAARAGRRRLQNAEKGDTPRFPWGDDWLPRRANTWQGPDHHHNTLEDGFLYTAPVGQFPPNDWGLYDTIGNVFEYCSDARAPGRGVGRGGSWWCSPGTCNYFNLIDVGRMSARGSLCNQGFRMVLDGTEDFASTVFRDGR